MMNINNVHYEYGSSTNANINAVEKVIMQEDASGWQKFSYGKLVEVTKNTRTFALQYETKTYTFAMEYEHDSRKNCASQMKREQFFSVSHFAIPLPTVNCQLSTVNCIHTIADFYSHSNYVELYYKYAKENGLSMDAEDIRPFSEMMNDENFMEYVNGEGGVLMTGKFPGSKDDSHKKMNMDSNKSFNGKKPYDEKNNPNGPTKHDAAKIAAQKELNNIIITD